MNKSPTPPYILYYTEKKPKVFVFLQDDHNFTAATTTGTPVTPAL